MKRVFSVLMSIVIVLSCIVFIMPPNIVLAANNADDIVSIARGELGSTNYSKYYGGNKGAWCADFVSWCAQQAGVDSIAKSSSCYNMYIGMKNNGCQEVSSPQKGDIVFSIVQNAVQQLENGVMLESWRIPHTLLKETDGVMVYQR